MRLSTRRVFFPSGKLFSMAFFCACHTKPMIPAVKSASSNECVAVLLRRAFTCCSPVFCYPFMSFDFFANISLFAPNKGTARKALSVQCAQSSDSIQPVTGVVFHTRRQSSSNPHSSQSKQTPADQRYQNDPPAEKFFMPFAKNRLA